MEEMFGGDAPISYVRHRFDGALVDTLAAGRDPAMSISSSGMRGTGNWQMRIMPIPFSPESAAAGSALGVAVTGGVLYEIGVYDRRAP